MLKDFADSSGVIVVFVEDGKDIRSIFNTKYVYFILTALIC